MSFLKRFIPLRSFPRFFYASQDKKMRLPSCWDLATGKERWEACQHAKGNTDPFFTRPVPVGPGTKDCPMVVPSVFPQRLVICLHCKPGLRIFFIHEGFPRRCACNKWFVLERIPIPKIYEDEPDYTI